jgi:hypothetical protein
MTTLEKSDSSLSSPSLSYCDVVESLVPADVSEIPSLNNEEDFETAEWSELSRIDRLTQEEMIGELQSIFEGRNYSWYTIKSKLEQVLDQGQIEYNEASDTNIFWLWNMLVQEREMWHHYHHIHEIRGSHWKDCLKYLKLIPGRACLMYNIEAYLVKHNMDPPAMSGPLYIEPPEKYLDEEGLRAELRRALLYEEGEETSAAIEGEEEDWPSEGWNDLLDELDPVDDWHSLSDEWYDSYEE